MMKFNRIFTGITSIGILAAGAVGVTYVIKKNPKNNSNIDSSTFAPGEGVSNPNLFPKYLDKKKIYSFIKIKNGKPFLDEALLVHFMKEIIKKSSFINGELNYWYKFRDNHKVLDIAFRWHGYAGYIKDKTYTFEITE